MNTLVTEILVGAGATLLTAAVNVLNPRLSKSLSQYVPGINKYGNIAKFIAPMVDPELADKKDAIEAIRQTLENIAKGEVSIPRGMVWVKRVAAKILDSNSMFLKLVEAFDEEFKATEFNKVNRAPEFFRADDGIVVSEPDA